jgi:hypothetical protein
MKPSYRLHGCAFTNMRFLSNRTLSRDQDVRHDFQPTNFVSRMQGKLHDTLWIGLEEDARRTILTSRQECDASIWYCVWGPPCDQTSAGESSDARPKQFKPLSTYKHTKDDESALINHDAPVDEVMDIY